MHCIVTVYPIFWLWQKNCWKWYREIAMMVLITWNSQLDDYLLDSVSRLSPEDRVHFWSLADSKTNGNDKTARSEINATLIFWISPFKVHQSGKIICWGGKPYEIESSKKVSKIISVAMFVFQLEGGGGDVGWDSGDTEILCVIGPATKIDEWDLAKWLEPKSELSWVRSQHLRHSGIWGAADETVLNTAHKKP